MGSAMGKYVYGKLKFLLHYNKHVLIIWFYLNGSYFPLKYLRRKKCRYTYIFPYFNKDIRGILYYVIDKYK